MLIVGSRPAVYLMAVPVLCLYRDVSIASDPNIGNVCSFSGATYTCTSHVRHNANYIPYAQIRFDLYVRESLASLSIAMAFSR